MIIVKKKKKPIWNHEYAPKTKSKIFYTRKTIEQLHRAWLNFFLKSP